MKGGDCMKITHTRKYEDTDVVLKLDKDFRYSDMERHGDKLLRLTESSGNRIANKAGFDLMYWCEAYNHKTKTIKVKFRKFL